MPIIIDTLENEVLSREYHRGEDKGRQEGRQEGQLDLLKQLLARRFGPLPAWAEESLASRSTDQLSGIGARLLDAKSLEDLLQ